MSTPNPIFAIAGSTEFSGDRDDHVDAGHSAALALANGTVSLSFNADDVSGRKTLFSKDGSGFDEGGHLTVWIQDGELRVRQQSDTASERLTVPEVTIAAGTDYHLSVSFGEDGLKVYLNGGLVAAEPEFKQGLEANDRPLLIGASGMYRTEDDQKPHNAFDGTISDVMMFGSQLGIADMAALAGDSLAAAALEALAVEDLMPAFAQAHQASDALKAIVDAAGFTHHGELKDASVTVEAGTDGADALEGDGTTDAVNGGLGDDVVNGNDGNDILQGGYGNDTVNGGAGNDVLDGGHGEDVLDGGDGDDIIVSQADAREGAVTYDADRGEGIDADSADQITGRVYLDQPIPGDDVMTGGAGADTFYFQTLINAKQKYIEKHTNDDGTIRWHRVAGENDNIHDHWVDIIGDDVITDFNRAEGDRIVIEGHTTEIASVTHGDANDDGVVDHSLIQLYSDQGGGGGAHNDDLLGTVTVYGDLVRESDIEHTSQPAYGIVKGIDKLDEALAPLAVAADTGPIDPPADLPTIPTPTTPTGTDPVFAIAGSTEFSGEEGGQLAYNHTSDLGLAEGTVAFTFNADVISGRDALFSKDANGFGAGGHLTGFVDCDGNLKIRMQSENGEEWLVAKNAVKAGQEFDFAVTFGDDGVSLFLDGELVDQKAGFTENWLNNEEALLIGANGWHSDTGEIGNPRDHFDGTIENFTILDEQLDQLAIQNLSIFSDDLNG